MPILSYDALEGKRQRLLENVKLSKAGFLDIEYDDIDDDHPLLLQSVRDLWHHFNPNAPTDTVHTITLEILEPQEDDTALKFVQNLGLKSNNAIEDILNLKERDPSPSKQDRKNNRNDRRDQAKLARLELI